MIIVFTTCSLDLVVKMIIINGSFIEPVVKLTFSFAASKHIPNNFK